jgi:hypothetical protein
VHREGGHEILHAPCWLELVDKCVLHDCCETFVQPNLIPPLTGDGIAEELMGTGNISFEKISRILSLIQLTAHEQ